MEFFITLKLATQPTQNLNDLSTSTAVWEAWKYICHKNILYIILRHLPDPNNILKLCSALKDKFHTLQ